MSEATNTVETPSPEATAAPAGSEATTSPVEKKASPAQDLRDIQNLLLGGIFPGNVSPAVVKAYQLLEAMARKVEQEAVPNASSK